MDRDALIQLFRVQAASIMGVASLSEAGNGPALSAQTSPFGAYRVGEYERVWDPTSVGLCVRDNPVVQAITLFYARKKAGGSESLSVIRQLLTQFEAVLNGQPPAWANGDGSVVRCRVTGGGEGGADEYAAVFEGSPTWAAGHLNCEILYCL